MTPLVPEDDPPVGEGPPRPRRPSSPQPKVNSLPSVVTTAEWATPADTFRQVVVVPSPGGALFGKEGRPPPPPKPPLETRWDIGSIFFHEYVFHSEGVSMYMKKWTITLTFREVKALIRLGKITNNFFILQKIFWLSWLLHKAKLR